MSKRTAYMESHYKRRENDDYPTIDPRCTNSFVAEFGEEFSPGDLFVDVCAPTGSGIVDRLLELGLNASCCGDAFADTSALGERHPTWIVTNPPFTRPLVNEIIMRQLERIDNIEVIGVAFLLRTNFDHAKERNEGGKYPMFAHPNYNGQIKMMFRPYWVERHENEKTPFHNYVWHIWHLGHRGRPFVMYQDGQI